MAEITKAFAEQSLNQDFAGWLEYHLSRTMANCILEDVKRFWCDGIVFLEMDLITLYRLNKEQILQANAWLGEDGQRKYRLFIHLGPMALIALAQGVSLQESVPGEDNADWFVVDADGGTITLYFN